MNIALYQIIVPALCLLLILKAGSHYLRKEKTIREFLAWVIFWGGIAIIAVFPSITKQLSLSLGIKSNVNAIFITLIGLLSYIVFKLVVAYEDVKRDVTRLTRAHAMEKYTETYKDNNTLSS